MLRWIQQSAKEADMRKQFEVPGVANRGPIHVVYNPRRVEVKEAQYGLNKVRAVEFVSRPEGKSLATLPLQSADAEFLIAEGADFGVSHPSDGSMVHSLRGYFFSPLTIRFKQPLPGFG